MTEIRHLLDDLSGQAGYYDVTLRALRGGARRRRRRRLAAGGSILAATVLIGQAALPSAPAPVPPPLATTASLSCTIEKLPIPDGYPEASVTGGDPSGRFLVGQLFREVQKRLVIWDSMRPKAIAVPGHDDVFRDINSRGVAVGGSWLDEGEAAWIYRDGKLSRLPGEKAAAFAISEGDVVVGKANRVPVVWRTPTSPPEPLALPSGATYGEAVGIGEDGYIVGTGYTPVDQAEPYGPAYRAALVWHPDGTVHKLPVPDERRSSYVFGFQGEWAVGMVTRFHQDPLAARWKPRTGAVEVFDTSALGRAVNGSGWLSGGPTPLLLTGSGRITLPTDLPGYQGLLNHDTGETEPAATVDTISDDGRQLAGSLRSTGAPGTVAVRWTCR